MAPRGEAERRAEPQADVVERELAHGVELIARGDFFSAHEALEEAWRAADPRERDFFQGLVHVAVAWYQAGRGNHPGCERQLVKATRRLSPFSPRYRGIDVADLVRQLQSASATVSRGSLDLPPPVV